MVGIFILSTFIICIIVDVLILKLQNKEHPAFGKGFTDDLLRFLNFSIDIPTDIFFSKAHSWVQKNEIGLVKIGIDDFLYKTVGEFQLTNFADIKKEINKGDTIFEISVNKKLIKIFSPIDGKVKSINQKIVNKTLSNPYTEWGVLLEPNNYKNDIKEFTKNNDTILWMKEELSKFKKFLNDNLNKSELVGSTMYDGGLVVNGVISYLPDTEIKEFENQFLKL